MRDRLVGAWRLLSFAFTDADGGRLEPLGSRPQGFLLVTPDGYLSLNFMAAERPRFAADDIFAGSLDEAAATAKAVVSFAGPFRIEGQTIIVEVDFSLFPNWIGGTQVRAFELAGDELVLRTVRALPIAGRLRQGEARLARA
jgi:hypothetical protein